MMRDYRGKKNKDFEDLQNYINKIYEWSKQWEKCKKKKSNKNKK